MASRFEIVYEEYIEELKDKGENENTKNSTEWWKNVFRKWATERNLQANLEQGLEEGSWSRIPAPFFARVPHPARFSSVSRIPLFFPIKIHEKV